MENVQYLEGDLNIVADALSRIQYLDDILEDDDKFDQELIARPIQSDINQLFDSLPTPQNFRNEQESDAGLQAWVKKHSSDPSTPYNPKLVPCTNATIYLWADANHQPPLILVPTTCKRSIFNHFHSLSHPGGKATYKLIKNTHYWPDMQKEISEWCKTCVQCQKNKVNRHTTSYLQALPKPTNRFSHIHIDILSGFAPSRNGNTKLLTIIDRWTNWAEAIPMSSTSTIDCARVLIKDWIACFGLPQVISSDRGKMFVSEIWSEVMQLLGIKHNKTTAYHPQANGKVERFHRTLKNALRARLNEALNWEDQLPWTLLGLRSTPNLRTGISPAMLVFGQPLDLPGQMILAKQPLEDETSFTKELYKAMEKQKFQTPI